MEQEKRSGNGPVAWATVLLLGFMAVLLVVGVVINTENVELQFGSLQDFSQGWCYADTGEPFPAEGVELKESDGVVLTATLPESLLGCNWLRFYNNHFHVVFLVEDEVLYEVGAESTDTTFGREMGRVWATTQLPLRYGGKQLVMQVDNQGKEKGRTLELSSFALGSDGAVYRSILQKNLPAIIVSVIALGFALVLLSYAAFMRINRMPVSVKPFSYLGLFSFVAAFWIWSDSEAMQMLGLNASLRYMGSYLSFMLLPLLLELFFRENTRHYKRPLTVFQAVYVGVSAVLLLLYVLGICHISVSRVAIHLLIVVLIAMLLVIALLEVIKHRDRQMLALLCGFAALGLAAIWNLATFYHNAMYDNSSAFRIGFLLFLFVLFCTTLRQGVADHHQKLVEQELAHREQIAQVKNDFLAKMSHDMRTPLNGIIGLSSLAKDNAGNPAETRRDIGQIQDSAQYLLSIINDILDMSKIESGKMKLTVKPFHMNEVTDLVLTILKPQMEAKELHFVQTTAPELDGVYLGDRVRLSQIIVNLLSNAVKFTPERGQIRLDLALQERRGPVDVLCVTVQDDGCGMSEDFMSRIFHPFEQDRRADQPQQQGTGLGLSIVKNLVELMNGSIRVQSAQGAGSTFTVQIPLERTACQPQAAAVQPHPQADWLEGAVVLLAEDHPVNANVATRILQKRGVQVEVAANGREAVELFEKMPPHHYQAILMDIRMPVMDGLEACRTIRGLKRTDAGHIPIIAMTANAFEDDRDESRRAGMNAHLAKPFDREKLYAVLEEWIRKTAPAAS